MNFDESVTVECEEVSTSEPEMMEATQAESKPNSSTGSNSTPDEGEQKTKRTHRSTVPIVPDDVGGFTGILQNSLEEG